MTAERITAYPMPTTPDGSCAVEIFISGKPIVKGSWFERTPEPSTTDTSAVPAVESSADGIVADTLAAATISGESETVRPSGVVHETEAVAPSVWPAIASGVARLPARARDGLRLLIDAFWAKAQKAERNRQPVNFAAMVHR